MAVAPEDPTSSGSSGPAKQNIDRYNNGYIISWILHKIFIFSNKV